MIFFVWFMFVLNIIGLIINISTLGPSGTKQEYYEKACNIIESFVIVLWAACLVW